MTEEKIDFSSLDPSRIHPQQWAARVDAIVRSIASRSVQKPTVWRQLVQWAVPSVAVAAAAAGILLGVALFAAESRDMGNEGEASAETASLISGWAAGETLPSTDRILTVLGGNND